MRPLGPVPLTRTRSTPSSRENLRMEGEAWGLVPVNSWAGITAKAGLEPEPTSVNAGGDEDGAATGAGAGAGVDVATAAGADAVAVSTASRVMMMLPSLTLSPTLSLNSFTTPAWLEGISMLALSDSTVIND